MARTFALIVPVQYVLQKISCSYETIPNPPKYYETDRNLSLGSNGVDWMCSLRKILTWLRGMNFCINCTSSPRYAPSFMNYEMLTNAPKHYETHKNMSVGANGLDRVRSLQQILTRLRGMKFCINCTSSVCFPPCFVQLRNHPKWTQTLCNAQKHEFRVQWRGSSAFVAKNYNVTSWHELLH